MNSCEPMSSYRIDDSVTFNDVPLDKALKKLVKAPFTVRISGLKSRPVSVEGLSGTVDSVMNRIAGVVAARVVQHGCVIEFIGNDDVLPPALYKAADQHHDEAQVWTLEAGHTNGQDLQAWGKKAGWKVVWVIQHDWVIPSATSFSGDFMTAATDVIKTLAANGALVRAKFYAGNKTMVVTGPGAGSQ